jgi:riboflavin synthase
LPAKTGPGSNQNKRKENERSTINGALNFPDLRFERLRTIVWKQPKTSILFAGFISGTKSTAVFTGLIEEVGSALGIGQSDHGAELQVAAPGIARKIDIGDSVAVNGCCLTVSALRDERLTFNLLDETLNRTNLKNLRPNSPVNLESALSADGRLGGHFVQGHIDCASRILSYAETGDDYRLEVELPAEFAHYVVNKGSIAINGISLTIAQVLPASFVVWIVPHTKDHTNLSSAQAGDYVNIEFDLLAKYIERMLPRHAPPE